MIYKIRDWLKHFENNRTRELKELRFVILPNKHDGDGYTELLDHPNGAAHYGAWCAIVQVASRGQHPAEGCDNPAPCCECRGVLLRDGAKPHDSGSLARITRIPALIFDEALPRLLGIGWLEQVCLEVKQIEEDGKIPHPPAGLSSKSRTPLRKSDAEEKRIEQDGIEQDGTEEKVVRAVKPHSPSNGKQSEEDFLVELQANEAYQKLNVKQVYAKMKAWCSVRGKVATRRRLINWLNREDQPMENSNGTYKPAGYQTAAERRDATFDRQLAVVNELRSRSSGTVDEVLCRKPG